MTEAEMTPTEWISHERSKLDYGLDAGELRGIAREFDDPLIGPTVAKLCDLSSAERDDKMIQNVLNAMKGGLPAEDTAVLSSVSVFVYPTYKVEGVATRTPRGDRVILLHAGLPLTLSRLSTLELHLHQRGDISRSVLLSAVSEISSLWKISGGAHGRATALDMHSINHTDAVLAGAMMLIAMAFVIGHEFGHLFENHGAYSTSDKVVNHKRELFADQWGLRFALRSVFTYIALVEAQPLSVCKYGLLGPFLALGMVAMLAPGESITHPAPSWRRDQIVALMGEIAEGEIGEQALAAFFHSIEDVGFNKTATIGSKLFNKLELYSQLIQTL
jgi:hypothetical protein